MKKSFLSLGWVLAFAMLLMAASTLVDLGTQVKGRLPMLPSFQTTPCTSLNSNTVINAPCANNYNSFVTNSSGSSSSSLVNGLTIYYEGDLQQNIGGNGHMGALTANASGLLNGTGASGARLTSFAGDCSATGNPTGSMGTLDCVRVNARVNSGATVAGFGSYLSYNPRVEAGATVNGNLGGFFADSPTIIGTVNGKVFSFAGGGSSTDFVFWGADGAKAGGAVFAAPDTLNNSFCHIFNNDGVTVKDCWLSGSGSPNGVMIGRVGAIYARTDGGAGSSFYLKESGTGNTGWVALGPTLTASLTTTASSSDVVSLTGVSVSSRCSVTATNASAATNLSSTYLAKGTNQVTVNHAATANMTYDILCSEI